jgi:hypothetical protein
VWRAHQRAATVVGAHASRRSLVRSSRPPFIPEARAQGAARDDHSPSAGEESGTWGQYEADTLEAGQIRPAPVPAVDE